MSRATKDPAAELLDRAEQNARRIAEAEAACGGPVENILLDVETIQAVEQVVAARKAEGDTDASASLFIRNAVRAALATENRLK